jgi:GDPmannose 4,6-dehydratase
MKKKIALITGVTGQDGSYLSEFLIKKNYIVYGLKRRSSSYNTLRIDHLINDPKKSKNFRLLFGDLSDSSNLSSIISNVMPDEIYNLGAQSHVSVSFDIPEYTTDINAMGALRILEIIKNLKKKKNIKLYQASTSELYGKTNIFPQNEKTPFYPRSPYACAKLFAYWITINYREAYNIFASNGILFNHESPRRGETFITRKITIALSKIMFGEQKFLTVGNLYSKRDWGDAEEYAQMQHLILQQKKPSDYVIATGRQYTVKKFIELSCQYLGFEIGWKGKHLKECGYVKKITNKNIASVKLGQIIVKIDSKYFRPTEVENLIGDTTKAYREFKWKPKTTIQDLIKKMLDSDIKITHKLFR